MRSYGSKSLDASLLLIPLVGFLPPSDSRVRGTVRAIEETLLWEGFVRRYSTAAPEADGMAGDEGVFMPCTFWLADAYERLGRRARGAPPVRTSPRHHQ